jgi:hypothetical protein
MIIVFWAETPTPAALAAASCPISNLAPTPTSGGPLDPSSIELNEILTNPKQDWNCDGKADGADQWIELKNRSNQDESLFGLQLSSQGQAVLLNSTDRIAANGFLIIFSDQIPTIALSRSYGQLQLLDGSGNTIDTVNYPPLGIDQSYSRDASGQWQLTGTPTPGAPNVINDGSPTPKPTPTKHSGGGGSGSSRSTATPTPIGTIFIPTDTPGDGVAFQGTGGGSSGSTGAGGNNGLALPSWLKITLLALIGALLLGVLVWYFRTWSQEPESDG